MSSRETAGATKPSLGQDWLSALRYWLRGRNVVIAMIVLAVVIGAALNWSWLVAVGIAPRITAASEPDQGPRVSLAAEAGALPELSTGGAIESEPDPQSQVLKERG